MTVINAMKLEDGYAGMVADTQSSILQLARKYDDLSSKIVPIETARAKVLVGGSGVSDILYEASQTLRESVPDDATVTEIAYNLSKYLIAMRRRTIDTQLRSQFGLEPEEAISGQKAHEKGNVSIAPALFGEIARTYQGKSESLQDLLNNVFIVIGVEDDKIKLYPVGMGHSTFMSARPYCSIGSGSDQADPTLYNFCKQVGRERLDSIPFVEGMAALIRATNAASDFNMGVGGIPSVSYVSKDGIVTMTDEESSLCRDIVRVADEGLVKPKDSLKALDDVLKRSKEHEKVEEDIFKKKGDFETIMHFLVGR